MIRPVMPLLVMFGAALSAAALARADTTLPVSPPSPAAGPRPVRLLFAGSSSTYWNDMPNEIAKAITGKVTAKPGAAVTAELVGRSGSDIRVYSEPGFNKYEYGVKPGQTFLEKVREEKFDFVVLMTVARFIMGDDDPQNRGGAAHADAITRYVQAIRDAGSEPVFYEVGWGKDQKTADGRTRLFELAKKNKIRQFVPCASAWAKVMKDRPDLALQHPRDSTHPGDLGHFLNVACFYAAFTGQSPEGKLPQTFHVWPHFSKEEREAKKAELEAAYARFQPDAYQSRLPEWMRRNAGAGLTATIDDATARYLEKVAWETTTDFVRRLGN